MPVPESLVEPCEPGADWPPSDGHSTGSGDPPLTMKNLLNTVTTPVYATHVVLRGTYLPGTVRCTSGNRHRFPSHVGLQNNWLIIYCFVDVRVSAYLLGTGPSTLTVIEEANLYADGSDDDDYGLEQLESRRSAYENALTQGGQFDYDEPIRGYHPPYGLVGYLHLGPRSNGDGSVATGPPGGIGGKEAVLFIGPSSNLAIETWEVRYRWELERRDDGTVVAIHPFSEYAWHLPLAEIELPALKQEVMRAHQERVAAHGGRIGADESLPMLETDANRLRQYFSDPKVGGYAPGAPTPAQPPPPSHRRPADSQCWTRPTTPASCATA